MLLSCSCLPFTQFALGLANNNLPNYVYVTPNICDHAHDSSLVAGDNWLASVVQQSINSSEFASTILFITYDEGSTNLGEHGSQGGGYVACTVVSLFATMGYQSQVQYSHYSLLATVEAISNLGNLGRNDATATVMQDLFTINLTRELQRG